MKRYIILIGILICIIAIIIFVLFKTNVIQIEISNDTNETAEEEEVVIPEEEISDEQMRISTVKLFFLNGEGELVEESREIDVKELVSDPYKTILDMLIAGPNTEGYEKLMPDGTKVLSTQRVEDVLQIDFSKEFTDNCNLDKNKQEKLIESILKTVVELREIEQITILVEGKEVNKLSDDGYEFPNKITLDLFK